MGIAAPEVLDEAAAAVEVATAAPPPREVVGVGIPEVKGTEAAEVAPAKATVVVEALGPRVVALGLRTLGGCKWRAFGTVWGEGFDKGTYASMTCTTPFATSTSGVTTLALLTKTEPFKIVMVTSLPWRVLIEVPFDRSVLYATVPLITWYSRILDNCARLKLPTAEPMAWKAALLGTKTVTSVKPSTAPTRLVSVRAPAAALRPASIAVAEMFNGIVRTASMT